MKDGQLSPLFINCKQRIPVGVWLEAEDVPTKGFVHGWHCAKEMPAPHIKKEPKSGQKRVWCEIEIDGWVKEFNRPEIQGGMWFIAEYMKVVRIIG